MNDLIPGKLYYIRDKLHAPKPKPFRAFMFVKQTSRLETFYHSKEIVTVISYWFLFVGITGSITIGRLESENGNFNYDFELVG